MTMRTHYCGNINENLIAKKVTLCGFVHRVRDLGSIIFVDLRDIKGLVQIVIDPKESSLGETAKKLHNECVIKIDGLVRARPEGLINPDLKSGKIEVEVQKIIIINSAETLPFPINETQDVNEDLKLRYRYLDLRREEMTKNIILRAKITNEIRNFLVAHDFIDIETPILTKSTPEGARDYLVPSRVHPGHFYALPQSPQIFKQLLMVAGFDRYFQIARCFRDEDLRSDRQPEFTQLDMEMSFIDAADIQNLMEKMIVELFAKILDVNLPQPFPRLSYEEAMTKYGSDKPDLRIPLEFIEIKDLFKESEFTTFKDAAHREDCRILALRVPKGNTLSRKQLDNYGTFVGDLGLKGLASLKVNDIKSGLNGLQSSLLKFLSEDLAKNILELTKAQDGDIILFASGMKKTVSDAMGALRIKIGSDLNLYDATQFSPLWVTDFPLFEMQKGRITSTHHPFTSPVDKDPDRLKEDPLKAKALAYDLVLNGIELGGGSMRIFNAELQKAVFNILSLDSDSAEMQFGHLLNAFKYGCPPHGGIAIGLDRLVMLMLKTNSIREVIPFPKTLNATCPLTQAPSKVSLAQLKDLSINTLEKTTCKDDIVAS